MIIAIIVIIGLSLLILGHEAGHFFAAKLFKLKVDEFGFGFPPRMFAWRSKDGETEYSLNWLPFGGFVRIAGERGEFEAFDGENDPAGKGAAPASDPMTQHPPIDDGRQFYTQPAWKKSVIILAGVFMNFIFGWIFISIVLMAGSPQTLIIASVEPNSPAAATGIQSGDIIKGYTDAQSFISYIDANKGVTTTVTIVRNDKDMTFDVTPRATTTADEGALGVELEQGGSPREGFFGALRDGLIGAWNISVLTVQAFWQLVEQLFAHASIPSDVVGPVGIFSLAEETGNIGLAYLLQFIGVISINLMVVNCIPFPALDGGRFIVILVEKIRRKPLSYKVEAWINGVGFALLLLLMVALTVRDVYGLL